MDSKIECPHFKLAKMVNEEKLQAAIQELRKTGSGKYTEIAQKYGIYPSTLYRRFTGKTVSVHEFQSTTSKLLSDQQEESLISYINDLTKRSMPPTPQMVKNFVQELVGHEIGHNWVPRFIERYETRLMSKYLPGIDRERVSADNSDNYEHYFKNVSTSMYEFNLC